VDSPAPSPFSPFPQVEILSGPPSGGTSPTWVPFFNPFLVRGSLHLIRSCPHWAQRLTADWLPFSGSPKQSPLIRSAAPKPLPHERKVSIERFFASFLCMRILYSSRIFRPGRKNSILEKTRGRGNFPAPFLLSLLRTRLWPSYFSRIMEGICLRYAKIFEYFQ